MHLAIVLLAAMASSAAAQVQIAGKSISYSLHPRNGSSDRRNGRGRFRHGMIRLYADQTCCQELA